MPAAECDNNAQGHTNRFGGQCCETGFTCDLCAGGTMKPHSTVADAASGMTCGMAFYANAEDGMCDRMATSATKCCENMPHTCEICPGGTPKAGDTVVTIFPPTETTCDAGFYMAGDDCATHKHRYVTSCCDNMPHTCDVCDGGTKKSDNTTTSPFGTETTCDVGFTMVEPTCAEHKSRYAGDCCE
jgi:hypothetical protein